MGIHSRARPTIASLLVKKYFWSFFLSFSASGGQLILPLRQLSLKTGLKKEILFLPSFAYLNGHNG